jgi:hypothetical protein
MKAGRRAMANTASGAAAITIASTDRTHLAPDKISQKFTISQSHPKVAFDNFQVNLNQRHAISS